MVGVNIDRNFYYLFSSCLKRRLHLVVCSLQDILTKIDRVTNEEVDGKCRDWKAISFENQETIILCAENCGLVVSAMLFREQRVKVCELISTIERCGARIYRSSLS